eukprot:COSAG02_NODE_10168_length_2003_cov_3.507612_3_plen_84_part_00
MRAGRKRTFGDLLRDKLSARGTGKKRALADPERVHAKQNLGQTPTQATFVERVNGPLDDEILRAGLAVVAVATQTAWLFVVLV